jgi:hypothetical protein
VSLSVEIREHLEAVEDRMEAAFASSRKLEFPASVTEALRNSGDIPSSLDVLIIFKSVFISGPDTELKHLEF